MTDAADADELVVLLDEAGAPIGTADKATVHTLDTPLHLAFSCHVIGPDGRALMTRRALDKRTFPGVWSNAFCGHPAPGEAPDDAVRRRARTELGLEIDELELVLPDFRYRAVDSSGVVENEVCPVFRARVAGDPRPAPGEVDDWAWVAPDAVRSAVVDAPYAFSPWLALQLGADPGLPA